MKYKLNIEYFLDNAFFIINIFRSMHNDEYTDNNLFTDILFLFVTILLAVPTNIIALPFVFLYSIKRVQ